MFYFYPKGEGGRETKTKNKNRNGNKNGKLSERRMSAVSLIMEKEMKKENEKKKERKEGKESLSVEKKKPKLPLDAGNKVTKSNLRQIAIRDREVEAQIALDFKKPGSLNGNYAWLDSIQQPKKRAFLIAYSKIGTISHAAGIAKVTRLTHYEWMNGKDEKEREIYRRAFEDAYEFACDSLEKEAERRAVYGTEKPVYQGGRKVGTIREYSDTLLIFLLKGARPEKYKERYVAEHKGGVSLELLVNEAEKIEAPLVDTQFKVKDEPKP